MVKDLIRYFIEINFDGQTALISAVGISAQYHKGFLSPLFLLNKFAEFNMYKTESHANRHEYQVWENWFSVFSLHGEIG